MDYKHKLEKFKLNFSRVAPLSYVDLENANNFHCHCITVWLLSSCVFFFLYCFVCRPVVITDVVRSWKAMNWTKSFLVSNYGDKRVSMKATEVRWTVTYMYIIFMYFYAKLIFKMQYDHPVNWHFALSPSDNDILHLFLHVQLQTHKYATEQWHDWAPVLAGVIILCSWARHFVLTVPLSAQGVNKNGYWLIIKYVW